MKRMIGGWFKTPGAAYNDFVKALLADDKKAMNYYMNKVALEAEGIPAECIRKYGFAFEEKKVLIG